MWFFNGQMTDLKEAVKANSEKITTLYFQKKEI